jgi:hypothetical protein
MPTQHGYVTRMKSEYPDAPASTVSPDVNTDSDGRRLAQSRTLPGMATIVRCIDTGAFEPAAIQAMSVALDDVCKALNIPAGAIAREMIAIRIIEHAGNGGRSSTELRDCLLAEAKGGTGC